MECGKGVWEGRRGRNKGRGGREKEREGGKGEEKEGKGKRNKPNTSVPQSVFDFFQVVVVPAPPLRWCL